MFENLTHAFVLVVGLVLVVEIRAKIGDEDENDDDDDSWPLSFQTGSEEISLTRWSTFRVA